MTVVMNQIELFFEGNQIGVFALQGEALTLGRDPASSIYIDHPFVSWLHAKIYLEDDIWIIEDQDSINGTVLNGKKISRRALKNRDRIEFGEIHLMVKIDADSDAESTYMASEFTMYLDNNVRQELIAGGEVGTANKANIAAYTQSLKKISHGFMAWLYARFPILIWARQYNKAKHLHGDISAGISVVSHSVWNLIAG